MPKGQKKWSSSRRIFLSTFCYFRPAPPVHRSASTRPKYVQVLESTGVRASGLDSMRHGAFERMMKISPLASPQTTSTLILSHQSEKFVFYDGFLKSLVPF